MPGDESVYPADWRRIAEKDLGRVRKLLDGGDAELAGFCLQQAVEKFLKAFLLSKGWKLRRVHDLNTLLDDALAHDSSLERFRDVCQMITAFYFVERYPLLIESGVTLEDVSTCLAHVSELIEQLRKDISS